MDSFSTEKPAGVGGDLGSKVLDRLPANRGGGCWLWQGTVAGNGYGSLSHAGNRHYAAHRAAYEVFNGDIPANLLVRHTCDTPLCCNPSHLILGTHSDNMKDSVARGRHNMARKTHCVRGHSFDQANTGWAKTASGGKMRYCRTCRRERMARVRSK